MNRWEDIIRNESNEIYKVSRKEATAFLTRIDEISDKISDKIDLILNKIVVIDKANGYPVHRIRHDPILREWEATFAVLHMGGASIVKLILCGFYLQAISLIRQELEGIAQLDYILTEERTTKKAPNICILEKDLRRVYSELSEGAHLASHDIVSIQSPRSNGFEKNIVLMPHGTSIIPVFDREVSSALFEIHEKLWGELFNSLDIHIKNNNIV